MIRLGDVRDRIGRQLVFMSTATGAESGRILLSWDLGAAVAMVAVGNELFAACGDTAFCVTVASIPSPKPCKLQWATPLIEDLGRQGASLTVYRAGPSLPPRSRFGQVRPRFV